jgi:hypothetical protein
MNPNKRYFQRRASQHVFGQFDNHDYHGPGSEHLAASLVNGITIKVFVVRRKEYGD